MHRRGWWLTAAAVLAAVAALEAGGLLATLEHAASDARASLLLHPIESDIVIIGIDARSLAAIERWPWPRRHHAALVRRLAEAAPERVFFDIDFSSSTNALDDAMLESALQAWPGTPMQLPAFFQPQTAADPAPAYTEPLARFARHSALVAVNRSSSSDGLEREWRAAWTVGGRRLRTVIDPAGRLPDDAVVPIDYSIAPSSFAYLPYVDVLDGSADLAELRGKTVYVGATAIELGDMVPVPLHRALPGVVVQALATESVRTGPPFTLPAWLATLALAGWTLACALVLRARAWRRNALTLAGATVVAAGVSVYAFASWGLMLETVPFMLATAGVFLAVTLQSLDRQTWRALAFALGMRRRDALLKSIVHSSADCILTVDAEGFIRTANPAAARLFGCGTDRLIGAPVSRFIPGIAARHADTLPHLLAGLEERVSEWDARTRAGAPLPVELSVGRVRLAGESLYTAIVRDVTERKAQQRELEHQATHDLLTQLPNRAALMQWLEAALTVDGPPSPVALMMLDLCRFKEVNDTLGHQVGDQVLREVAGRFREALGTRGRIARIGGDEFIVVQAGAAARTEIEEAARRLREALRRPIDAAGVSLEVGLSIGIARCPEDARDAESLLKHADVAMYVAKRRGSDAEFYDPALDHHSVRRLSLASELRTAIAQDGLQLHYQPKVGLGTGAVAGVEALLRWQHPALGRVDPAEFIAVAESTDLIRPLTDWTVARALADARRWRSERLAVTVAVNLSARLLQDAAFPARLSELLAAAGAEPAWLELEITESAMMQDPARALGVIREIHDLGVCIAIDDYGTGYSSLAYLRELPVHALKLDRAFVKGIRSSAGDRIIVESTAQMAHALRLQVVAEGVETEWDAAFLAEAGYDLGQGYYFSPALPADDCARWIREFRPARELRARRATRWAGRKRRRP
jgi:diguanylate cyclase (GGDEF)-like protein/PAS domain S-box-containing protein